LLIKFGGYFCVAPFYVHFKLLAVRQDGRKQHMEWTLFSILHGRQKMHTSTILQKPVDVGYLPSDLRYDMIR